MKKGLNRLLALVLSFAMILTGFTFLGGAVTVNAAELPDIYDIYIVSANEQPATGGTFKWAFYGADDSVDWSAVSSSDFGVEVKVGDGEFTATTDATVELDKSNEEYDGVITASVPANTEPVVKQWRFTYAGSILDYNDDPADCPAITQAAAEEPQTDEWTATDFVVVDGVITGLSETGTAKLANNKNLVFPDTLVTDGATKIGANAFRELGLTGVTFPDGLTEIGLAAFQMNSIAEVILPDSVEKVDGGAFGSNPTITRIVLPKNPKYTTVAGGSFGCSDAKNWMKDLTSIVIPENVTKIEANAFAGNNFEEINIPSSVTTIGNMAFSTKNYLKTPCKVNLSEGLQTLGTYVFRNKIIEEIYLPASLQSMKANDFVKEYSDDSEVLVTKVYVANNTQFTDKKNFPDNESYHHYYYWNPKDFSYGKYYLGEIPEGASQTNLNKDVFPGNDNSNYLTEELNVITGFSESGEAKLADNKAVVFPNKDIEGNAIQGIGPSAFKAKGLTSIQLPEGVFADNNTTWPTYNNEEVAKRGDFFILNDAFSTNELEEVTIPEGVLFIAKNAFFKNKLQKATFPKSIMVISQAAFGNNTSDGEKTLTEVEFPTYTDFNLSLNVQCFAIGALTSVWLPENVGLLNKWAFLQNTGMEPVTEGTSAEKKGGVVWLYNVDLEKSSNLAYRSNPVAANVSNVQDIKTNPVVSFDTNGSTDTVEDIVVTSGKIENMPKPKLENYKLLGWFTEKEGGEEVTSDTVITENCKLYAHWTYANLDQATVTVPNQVYKKSYLKPAVEVKLGETVLTADTDYSVTYSNNLNAGVAEFTVTAKGDYYGSKEGTFIIEPVSIEDFKITLEYDSVVGDGEPKEPSVKVEKTGYSVLKADDYTVSYDNNTEPGTATATIEGKGNYQGTRTVEFAILSGEDVDKATEAAEKAEIAKNTADEAAETAKNALSEEGVADATNEEAVKTAESLAEDAAAKADAAEKAAVESEAAAKKAYGETSPEYAAAKEATAAAKEVKASANASLAKAKAAAAKVEAAKAEAAQAAAATVAAQAPGSQAAVDAANAAKAAADKAAQKAAEATAAANTAATAAEEAGLDETNPVTADVNDAKSAASDAVTKAASAQSKADNALNDAINAKSEADRQGVSDPKLPKVTSKKGTAKKTSVTVKWKKLSKKNQKKADKIEVWVCPDKKFAAENTKAKVVSKKKAAAKVSGLKKKTTYYVKVRSIKTVNGVKYVGKWSKVKKIKTKK